MVMPPASVPGRDDRRYFILEGAAFALARGSCTKEFELGRRMPQEAHLDAVGDAAGVRPDPRLVRVEDDADLTGPIAGFGGGRAAVI